ncbi:MAG TPA: hypothetical protein VFV43_00620 [Limnobacter sp.]|nr:hypothetical protein [Limnobacter sp.]
MNHHQFVCPLAFLFVFLMGCGKPDEQNTFQNKGLEESQNENWLFGQWTTDFGEGFELAEECKRPLGQFGKDYVYWRFDIDGDPYEELNKVEEYLIEGALIRARVLPPTSFESRLVKDGTMHFKREPDGSATMINHRRPGTNMKLVKCQSSPLPYSADVAPTPPKYEGIEPGIVDRPRDGT